MAKAVKATKRAVLEDSVLEAVRAKHGEDAALRLDGTTPFQVVETTSSGALTLDAALGGGWARGRIVELYGHESSGKTTLALHAIAEVQRLDEAAAFIDAEHALDTQYAEALGVDLARLYLSQPDSGEQALDIVETFVQTGDVSLVVIDSVAALTPLCELEGAMGDQHVGAQARLMSRALRKLASIANKKRCTLIFLNQIRMKIGVMYGNPETTPGGNALKFYSSQRLQCGRRAHIKSGEEAVGNHINVKVVKNKVAVPFQEADLSIVWGKGVDRYADLLEAAVAAGVVTKAGAWYSVGERKLAQGANTAALRLAEDAELHAQVYADTRRLMLGGRHAAR